jgi:hypothetical protein
VTETTTERFVLYCHVEYDGGHASPGHQDVFHGLGYEWGKQQALEAGWVNCGNRWCCPACANDQEVVTVWKIQDPMFGGPVIYTDKARAEQDFADWKDGLDEEDIARLTFTTDEMSRAEINRLPEFDGY